jgi:hypothetical protein
MAPKVKPHYCLKCNGLIPPSVIIDDRLRKLQGRKYCLACSPWGGKNSRKLELVRQDGLKACQSCKEDFPISVFKKKIPRCPECQARRVWDRAREHKRWAVAYLGGKCEECDYDRCLAALEFHHQDSGLKEKMISKIRNRAKLIKELRKCRLLCCRCHAEVHNPDLIAEAPDCSRIA